MAEPDLSLSSAVALVAVGREACFLDREESHDLLTELIMGLDLEEARQVIDRLVLLVYAAAGMGGVDLDDWLPRIGLAAADGTAP